MSVASTAELKKSSDPKKWLLVVCKSEEKFNKILRSQKTIILTRNHNYVMYIELHRMPSGGPRVVVELVSTCTVIQFQKKMVLFFTKKIEKMSSI
jgi:hypothetical protein